MLRPLLVAASLASLTACSSAVGSAPGIQVRGPDEAIDATVDATADDTVDATVDEGTTTVAAPATPAPEQPAADVAPQGSTEPPEDVGGRDAESDVSIEPIAPPDPPLSAVWQEDGPETQRAQEFLLSLGFWLAEANGQYGTTTSQAVMAFQKYHGLTADGKLGPQTAAAMNSVSDRPVGRSTGGTLVEVDKSKQLVFIVRDGVTEWVLNTSTGSEIPYREPDQNTPGVIIEDDSITRPGVFAVNRQREDGWWEGDLGEIYRPKYFDGGIALHGAYSIPSYPASHGCVRLSVQAMDWIWEEDIVPMGMTVWVHGEIPDRDT